MIHYPSAHQHRPLRLPIQRLRYLPRLLRADRAVGHEPLLHFLGGAGGHKVESHELLRRVHSRGDELLVGALADAGDVQEAAVLEGAGDEVVEFFGGGRGSGHF